MAGCCNQYRSEAEEAYRKRYEVWLTQNQKDPHDSMWYQGNALDTLIDYVSLARGKSRAEDIDLGTKIDDRWSDAINQGGWFDSWMGLPDVPENQCPPPGTGTCSGFPDVKPSLLDSDNGLVRERVPTMGLNQGCYAIDPVYECVGDPTTPVSMSAMNWTGDQGLVLGAMVDLMSTPSVNNPPDVEAVKGILDGVLDHLTQKAGPHDDLADGVLRPWSEFDGWKHTDQCGEGFQLDRDGNNYLTGPGVFMRYLPYAYRNNEGLREYVRSEFGTMIEANAKAVMDDNYDCCCPNPISAGPKYDSCNLACQTNRLAIPMQLLEYCADVKAADPAISGALANRGDRMSF